MKSSPPTPRWRGLAALLALLAIGSAVALYLTFAHLSLFRGAGSFHSLCDFGERFRCDLVNTSDYSEIGGVAIALFAVPAYATLALLTFIGIRSEPARARIALALAHAIAWVAAGYSVFLLFIMVTQLGTLCLFCLTLDAVTVSALALTAWSARATPRELLREIPRLLSPDGLRVLAPAIGLGGAVLAVALLGHAQLREHLEAEARASVTAANDSGPPPASAPTGAAPGGDEPSSPRRKLPTKRWPVSVDDDDASWGDKTAKVVIVQFADFQCGYCKKLEHAMAAVRKDFADSARFVFKHFPMNPRCNGAVQNERHAFACDAAVAAECARRQGKFWPMHAQLYKNQHRLGRADIDHYAALAGLDPASFEACRSDPAALDAVRKDADDGARVEVNGTPRTFINGRLFSGALSEDLLAFVIRIELGQVTGRAAEAYAPPAGTAIEASTPAPASPSIHIAHGDLSFTIDAFEASIDASGSAQSAPGALPAVVSYAEARRACEKAGKRLCTSEEWVSACQGALAIDEDKNGDFADDYVEGTQYPYADWYEPSVCRDAEDGAAGPGATGARPKCRTPAGVYDLAGNVAEWTGASPERAVLLGGGSSDREKAACYRPKRRDAGDAKGGFRCCK